MPTIRSYANIEYSYVEFCARFGHVFLWDSGSSVGEISGHGKFINGIAYRPVRPFRVVTASEDKHVNFYEGPPFRFKTAFQVSCYSLFCCSCCVVGVVLVVGVVVVIHGGVVMVVVVVVVMMVCS